VMPVFDDDTCSAHIWLFIDGYMIAVIFAYITLRYHFLTASNMIFIWPLQLILLLAIKSSWFLLSPYFELGPKKRCTVRKWNNNVLVDIREVIYLDFHFLRRL